MNYPAIAAKGLSLAKPEFVTRTTGGWSFPDGATLSVKHNRAKCTCLNYKMLECCEHIIAIQCIDNDETKNSCEKIVASHLSVYRDASFLANVIARGSSVALAIKQQQGDHWHV